MESGADRACHELLLRLAGRLPDEPLWRLRDWLAAGGRSAVGATLPRALLRNRVGLTAAERDLLVQAVGGWGAPRRLLDAVLPVQAPEAHTTEFRADTLVPDVAALCVLAVARGEAGVREVRHTLRLGPRWEQRVVLVLGADRPWTLTGSLQRLLRAHGDRTPCVEVLPGGLEPTLYHQAAIAGSTLLWAAAGEPTPAAPVGASTSA
ncbi:hypothetical protein ACFQE5_17280 [Pseudonocardia hispaniensis]|uniref:Uncharacterized protein n=1 Tax=Pseudonocardia hispaniensis TaxID=904933 RepID=A0ABW1J6I4_9PSEU